MSSDPCSNFVLDSFALLALLDGEPGAPRVQQVLQLARRRQARASLCTINLGEVLYITERERGLPAAQQALAAIEQLPINILEATRERVFAAAHVKATVRLSYAYAVAVAMAHEFDATVLTGDPEFRAVEHLVSVEWLPRAP